MYKLCQTINNTHRIVIGSYKTLWQANIAKDTLLNNTTLSLLEIIYNPLAPIKERINAEYFINNPIVTEVRYQE